ncbi:MAG: class I SAM-dependent RNA methyltransferase [Pyrinomonadaceae bacterium]
MKNKYQIGETLNVTIEIIVPNGYGLAFAENLTVFVPLAAAGDQLRVRIYQVKNKTAFAEIVEILEPSDLRIEPPCEYFGRCGGCDFQQMNYENQLAAKVAIIKDCLTRIGKIKYEKEIEIIPSPREFNYRARAQWHVDTRRQKVGYFQRNSHKVIDVQHCPILTEDLQKILTEVRETIEWESFWSEKIEIEAAGANGNVSLYSSEIIEPTEEISFTVNGEKYFYSAKIFFQGNPFLIEKLLELALQNASGKTALDLYCGVGLFTLPLARKFEKVIGVEANRDAIDFAGKSVENARLENVEFYTESVDDFLDENKLSDIDFILLDPPRSGAEKRTIENIIKIKPERISYVSCEPSVLARDLRMLIDNGYTIESMTALDLFPQTHHIETVVSLKYYMEK